MHRIEAGLLIPGHGVPVRTIEHGTFLDDECCDAMRETAA
jgi:hypothetical protein